MAEHEDALARVVRTLQEPVRIDPSLDRRVMSKIENGGVGSLTTEERLFLDRFTPA